MLKGKLFDVQHSNIKSQNNMNVERQNDTNVKRLTVLTFDIQMSFDVLMFDKVKMIQLSNVKLL